MIICHAACIDVTHKYHAAVCISKSVNLELDKKAKFNVNWHFKVKCFGISGMPTRDSVSMYNMLASSLNFPKIQPAKSLKIAVVDNPTVVLTPPLQGTPAIIRINLLLPETRVIGLYLRR